MKKKALVAMSLAVICGILGNAAYAVYNNEGDNAIQWLYSNQLTHYASSRQFRSNDPITREQLAKFIVGYDAIINQMQSTAVYNGGSYDCQFNDIYKSDSTLVDDIYSACSLGLMQGGNHYFSPKQYVTNEQFVAVLMRLMHGYQNERGNDRSTPYYQALVNEGIYNDLDIFTKTSPITRGEVAIMLYRAANNVGYTYNPPYFPANPDNYFPYSPIITKRGDIAFTSASGLRDNYIDGGIYYQFTLTNTGNTSLRINSSDYITCQMRDSNGTMRTLTHYLPAVMLSAKNVLTVKTSSSESLQLLTNSNPWNATSCTAYIANDPNTANNTITVNNSTFYPPFNTSTAIDLIVDQIRIKYLRYDQQPVYEILIRNRGGDTAYINAINYLTIDGIQYTSPLTLGYNQSTRLQLSTAPSSYGNTYLIYNGAESDTSNNRIPAYNVNTLLNDYYTRTNNNYNNNNNDYYGMPDFKILNTHLRYTNGQFMLGMDMQNIGQTAYTTRLGVSCTIQVNGGNSFPISYDDVCLQTSSTSYYGGCTHTLNNNETAQVQPITLYGITYGDSVSISCTINPDHLVSETNYYNNTYSKSFYSPYNDY